MGTKEKVNFPKREKFRRNKAIRFLFVLIPMFIIGGIIGIVFAFSNVKYNIEIGQNIIGGQIICETSSEDIKSGSDVTYRIIPEEGYEIDKIFIDGEEVDVTVSSGKEQVYVFEKVNSDHTITATFVIRSFVLGSGDFAGGTITPESIVKKYGESQIFTITPNIGYKITSIIVDAGTENEKTIAITAAEGASQLYTFSNIKKDSTISATFTIRTFEIAVEQAENGEITPNSVTKNYGDNQIFIITPNEGYKITKIIIDGVSETITNNDSEEIIRTISNIKKNQTITAEFDIISYTVIFKDYDGTTLKTETVTYGNSATAPENPERESTAQYTYDFNGWDKEFNNITGNLTVTVVYNEILNHYTVTFIDHDGLIVDTQSIAYGSNATLPEDPIWDGHIFNGWAGSHTNIQKNEELTAIYDINVYEVIFKDHDGTTLKELTVDHGSFVTAPANPSRETTAQYTYIFEGWKIQGGDDTVITDISTFSITQITNFIAYYSESVNHYNVIFRDHDGSIIKVNGEDSQSIAYGYSATAPANPTREATAQYTYEFTGWDKAFNSITGDLTVTAVYSEIINYYTVTFKDWDGTVLTTQSVAYGSKATPPTTSREGYNFTGWNISYENITSDTILTAQYAINEYSVTFKDWDGTVLSTQSIEYGSAATAPGNPTKEATAQYTYEFSGWDINFNNITSNLTITATYIESIRSYTVIFKDYDGTIIQVNSQDSQLIEYGSDATAPADPTREGYRFNKWSSSFNFITNDLIITAEFIQQIQITIIQAENGTISPSDTFYVDINSNKELIITPAEEYYLVELIINGNSIQIENTGEIEYYTLQNIVETHTISAIFGAIGPFTFTESKVIESYTGGDGLVELSETEENTFTLNSDSEILLPEICLGSNETWYYKSSIESEMVKHVSKKTFLAGIYMVVYSAPNELEGWEYSLIDNKYYITGVPSGSGTLIIPHQLNTTNGVIDIYGIGGNYYSTIIKGTYNKIIIEENITSIGNHTFYRFINLTEITIPDSVTNIGEGAFDGCTNLKSITIPSNVSSIATDAFRFCTSLTAINVDLENTNYSSDGGILFNKLKTELITYPAGKIGNSYIISNSVISIGLFCFDNCSNLTEIIIPNSVENIGENAFSGCTSLTSIIIPDSVTNIEGTAFISCLNLIEIIIPDSVINIGSNAFLGTAWFESQQDGVVYAGKVAYVWKGEMSANTSIELIHGTKGIAGHAFYNCSSLTSITIPNTVTIIAHSAFRGCSSLSSIIIPNSVTTIGLWAFSDCSSLTTITIPDSITEIGYAAFQNCSSLQSIIIPFVGNTLNGYTSTHFGYIFGTNSSQGNSQTVPSSLKTVVVTGGTTIERLAFEGCINLNSITIPDSVTIIAHFAFKGCSSLSSIIIPDSVENIGDYAFSGCSSLASITIPNNVENIEDGTFQDCTSLVSITISNNVRNIGYAAFLNCLNLTEITIPNTVTNIGQRAFEGCSSLTEIIIPNNVTIIPYNILSGCSSLTSITIPFAKGSQQILGQSSSIPSSLTTIIITGGTEISTYAFQGYSNLTQIVIPDSVVSIGVGAFNGTAWFESQQDGVVYAGKVAYVWKGSMPENTSIILREGTKGIADSAFDGFYSLTSITILDSVVSIGRRAFANTAWLDSQADGVVYAGKVAYVWKGSMPENTSITLREGTKSITHSSFYDCKNLIYITVPNSVISIGGWAFYGCTNLESIIFEEGSQLMSIGEYTFYDCTNLTEITIPDSVTIIERAVFQNCSSLTAINVDSNNIYYSSDLGVLFNKSKTILITYPSGKTEYNYNIPNSVKSIGENAFFGCTSLTSITISDSVISIDGYAFSGCSNLTGITIPNNVITIGQQAFYNCSSLTTMTFESTTPPTISSYAINSATTTIYVPAESVDAYKAAPGWSNYASKIFAIS